MATRSKNDVQKRRFKAREFGEQKIEALGETPYIELECSDGAIIMIRHPMRLDDDALARFELADEVLDRAPLLDPNGEPRRDEAGDVMTRIVMPHHIDGKLAEPLVIRQARALLGEADHRRLLADGLSSVEIVDMWQDLSRTPGPDEDTDEADGDTPKGNASYPY